MTTRNYLPARLHFAGLIPAGSLLRATLIALLFVVMAMALLLAGDLSRPLPGKGVEVPAASDFSDWHGNVAPSGAMTP